MASLCIACCSTIKRSGSEVFKTNCCNKQICGPCLQANPRLRYYSPCLACCGAVQVVSSTQISTNKEYKSPLTEQQKREETTFAIGDDSDDDQAGGGPIEGPSVSQEEPSVTVLVSETPVLHSQAEASIEHSGPAKYWIRKGDTLHGIALRFKLDSREVCKLNGLPFSTLSTTPHLLHTRASIMLPPTDKKPPPPPPEAEEREERRRKERAAKQFQFVTKEVDWGVAKTYVALADNDEADDDYGMKRKEADRSRIEIGTSAGAVGRYLDDDEWEGQQLKAGVAPRILPFPFFASKP